MSNYKNELEMGNIERQNEKYINIAEIKKIIETSWKANLEIENGENKEITKFEKITKILQDKGFVSGKKDLAQKITILKDGEIINKEIKGSFSYDEIGIAISEFVDEIKDGDDVIINLHKQTVARIIGTQKEQVN